MRDIVVVGVCVYVDSHLGLQYYRDWFEVDE